MDDICRLCCSPSFVNNNIFDEENALYLKMSLYLPIKVFKNDRLPQKVCDKCSCKVNDFYQFCNETIEVQERLRAVLLASGEVTEDIVDLTRIKQNISPVPDPDNLKLEQGTQTEWDAQLRLAGNLQQTADTHPSDHVQIKEEPQPLSPMKQENEDLMNFDDGFSDNSDDLSLIDLKKKKKNSKKEVNGVKKKAPRKRKLKDWTNTNGSTETSLPAAGEVKLDVKVEPEQKPELHLKEVKREADDNLEVFHCCICFVQQYSRAQLLQHYRQHVKEATAPGAGLLAPPAPPPPPPPPAPAPDAQPPRCPRCRKSVRGAGEWAAHWARHAARDRRPLRCALCEKGFRDPAQALKHGLTHKFGAGEEDTQPAKKRFVCDLCPEGFVYMRSVLAHRAAAHPGARGALVLRCAECARQFAHLNSLRRHLRAHSGERNHLCNVCGKALSSREHLKFHIRIHTGYKPNVCKTCGKGFVKKCNLTLHERVHSGEKPHVCAHCGKAFSQRSTLVIHERYHSGARPYACKLCGRGFVAKGLLSMHLKSTCIWCVPLTLDHFRSLFLYNMVFRIL